PGLKGTLLTAVDLYTVHRSRVLPQATEHRPGIHPVRIARRLTVLRQVDEVVHFRVINRAPVHVTTHVPVIPHLCDEDIPSLRLLSDKPRPVSSPRRMTTRLVVNT